MFTDKIAALFAAAQNNDSGLIQRYIDSKADLNVLDEDGDSALLIAVNNNHEAAVSALINAKVNTNLKDSEGRTALIIAATKGNPEIVAKLLSISPKINEQDNIGWTALLRAAYNGHASIVSMLIKSHSALDIKDNVGRTAVMWAAAKGHLESVKSLISAGANIHFSDNLGINALLLAAKNGHDGVVEALKLAGAKHDAESVISKAVMSATLDYGFTKVKSLLAAETASSHFSISATPVLLGSPTAFTPTFTAEEIMLKAKLDAMEAQLKKSEEEKHKLAEAEEAERKKIIAESKILQDKLAAMEADLAKRKLEEEQKRVQAELDAAEKLKRAEVEEEEKRRILENSKYQSQKLRLLESKIDKMLSGSKSPDAGGGLQYASAFGSETKDGKAALAKLDELKEGYVRLQRHADIVDSNLGEIGSAVLAQQEQAAILHSEMIAKTKYTEAKLLEIEVSHMLGLDTLALDVKSHDREILLKHDEQKKIEQMTFFFERALNVVKAIANKHYGASKHALARRPNKVVTLIKGKISIANGLRGIAAYEPREVTGRAVLNFLEKTDLAHVVSVRVLALSLEAGSLLEPSHLSPLMLASQAGNMDLIIDLLRRGARINLCNEEGLCALILAVTTGHHDCVSLLLCNGAEVDRHNNKGETPLMLASKLGHIAVVKTLIEYHANPYFQLDGKTALHLAYENEHGDVVSLLVDYMKSKVHSVASAEAATAIHRVVPVAHLAPDNLLYKS